MPIRRTLTRLRETGGFTLIEMLISMSLFAVVAAAVMTPLVVSQRLQNSTGNYNLGQQQAQAGLDSMVAQIRQAWSILSTTPNSIEMNVNLNGTAYHVLYECDVPQTGTPYNECVRVSAAVGASLPSLATGTVLVSNLVNGTTADPVFSFAPDQIAPYYMTATVKVPASAGQNGGLGHAIAYSDGALMRNENVGD